MWVYFSILLIWWCELICRILILCRPILTSIQSEMQKVVELVLTELLVLFVMWCLLLVGALPSSKRLNSSFWWNLLLGNSTRVRVVILSYIPLHLSFVLSFRANSGLEDFIYSCAPKMGILDSISLRPYAFLMYVFIYEWSQTSEIMIFCSLENRN